MNKELEKLPLTSGELIECINEPGKRAFLNSYHKTRQITKTATEMSITPRTVHYWLVKDGAFSEAFSQLKKELDVQLQEHYESLVQEVADDKGTPPQSRLLASFFSLKALDDKYKDKHQPMVSIGEIIVNSAIPRPEYKAIEGEYEEITT